MTICSVRSVRNGWELSGVIRVGELQAWFAAEHVVDTPAVRVDAEL